ncbi:MAG: hypothetical protein ACXW61_03310 [Gemmatirosa sp.]
MSRTLPSAREAFVAAMTRDTPGTDLSRYVAVLDALIAWSEARPTLLRFRADEKRNDVVSFERTGAKAVIWSVQTARNAAPRLEIHVQSGQPMTSEDRATVLQTLNAHSRDLLVEGDRLRIGFGALKNVTTQSAVFALLEQLLTSNGQPAESSR